MKTDDRVNELVQTLATDMGLSHQALLETKITDLELDSMDLVTLVFDIEEALDIEIDINNLDAEQTVSELISAGVAVDS